MPDENKTENQTPTAQTNQPSTTQSSEHSADNDLLAQALHQNYLLKRRLAQALDLEPDKAKPETKPETKQPEPVKAETKPETKPKGKKFGFLSLKLW